MRVQRWYFAAGSAIFVFWGFASDAALPGPLVLEVLREGITLVVMLVPVLVPVDEAQNRGCFGAGLQGHALTVRGGKGALMRGHPRRLIGNSSRLPSLSQRCTPPESHKNFFSLFAPRGNTFFSGAPPKRRVPPSVSQLVVPLQSLPTTHAPVAAIVTPDYRYRFISAAHNYLL